MAKKLITEQDVFDAAQEITATGETPSTLTIHKALGRGSYSTIQKYLKVWEQSDAAHDARIDTLPAVVTLPDALADDAASFGKKLWKVANDLAEAKLDQERLQLNNLKETFETSTQQAVDYADECNNRADTADEALEQASISITTLKGEVDKNHRNIEKMAGNIESLSETLKQTTGERDALLLTVSELQATVAELSTKVQLSEQATAAAEAALAKTETASALALSDAESKSERDLDKAINDLTNAHDKAFKALELANDKSITSTNDAASKAAEQYEATITGLSNDKSELSSELKVLREELKTINKSKHSK